MAQLDSTGPKKTTQQQTMSGVKFQTPEEIMASMPYPELTTCDGEPNYKLLVTIRNEIKENYASIPSVARGAENGYLGEIMANAAYSTVCATTFTVPADPGALTIEAGTTAVDSNHQNRTYTENKRCYQEWQSLEQACRNQLIKSIPKEYMEAKANKCRVLAGVRAREILEHLFTKYGAKLAQDLVENRVKMGVEWDPTTAFQNLVIKVQDIQEFATDGGRSIEEVDITYVLYTVIYNTGAYYEKCNKWPDKSTVDKTGENFQTFFQDAHRKLRNKSQSTIQKTGHHGMNAMVPHGLEDTNEALINMV